ncbi:hypothetical protein [Saliterribacillus persicus]|uniref:hypothetical protein n=1 Tax=Saliterribacillus persicus TaxID=930114 RepID=UPI001474ED25|nr:hypothetical protein [Saliterribacillus persicus]
MPFNMRDKLNQLVERTSNRHVVVSVDIAQQTHVARVMNNSGIVIKRTFFA